MLGYQLVFEKEERTKGYISKCTQFLTFIFLSTCVSSIDVLIQTLIVPSFISSFDILAQKLALTAANSQETLRGIIKNQHSISFQLSTQHRTFIIKNVGLVHSLRFHL